MEIDIVRHRTKNNIFHKDLWRLGIKGIGLYNRLFEFEKYYNLDEWYRKKEYFDELYGFFDLSTIQELWDYDQIKISEQKDGPYIHTTTEKIINGLQVDENWWKYNFKRSGSEKISIQDAVDKINFNDNISNVSVSDIGNADIGDNNDNINQQDGIHFAGEKINQLGGVHIPDYMSIVSDASSYHTGMSLLLPNQNNNTHINFFTTEQKPNPIYKQPPQHINDDDNDDTIRNATLATEDDDDELVVMSSDNDNDENDDGLEQEMSKNNETLEDVTKAFAKLAIGYKMPSNKRTRTNIMPNIPQPNTVMVEKTKPKPKPEPNQVNEPKYPHIKPKPRDFSKYIRDDFGFSESDEEQDIDMDKNTTYPEINAPKDISNDNTNDTTFSKDDLTYPKLKKKKKKKKKDAYPNSNPYYQHNPSPSLLGDMPDVPTHEIKFPPTYNDMDPSAPFLSESEDKRGTSQPPPFAPSGDNNNNNNNNNGDNTDDNNNLGGNNNNINTNNNKEIVDAIENFQSFFEENFSSMKQYVKSLHGILTPVATLLSTIGSLYIALGQTPMGKLFLVNMFGMKGKVHLDKGVKLANDVSAFYLNPGANVTDIVKNIAKNSDEIIEAQVGANYIRTFSSNPKDDLHHNIESDLVEISDIWDYFRDNNYEMDTTMGTKIWLCIKNNTLVRVIVEFTENYGIALASFTGAAIPPSLSGLRDLWRQIKEKKDSDDDNNDDSDDDNNDDNNDGGGGNNDDDDNDDGGGGGGGQRIREKAPVPKPTEPPILQSIRDAPDPPSHHVHGMNDKSRGSEDEDEKEKTKRRKRKDAIKLMELEDEIEEKNEQIIDRNDKRSRKKEAIRKWKIQSHEAKIIKYENRMNKTKKPKHKTWYQNKINWHKNRIKQLENYDRDPDKIPDTDIDEDDYDIEDDDIEEDDMKADIVEDDQRDKETHKGPTGEPTVKPTEEQEEEKAQFRDISPDRLSSSPEPEPKPPYDMAQEPEKENPFKDKPIPSIDQKKQDAQYDANMKENMNQDKDKEKERDKEMEMQGIDKDKQNAQDDAHYHDMQDDDDNVSIHESDDEVTNEMNTIMNPTPNDMLSNKPMETNLNRNVQVIGDATEINDVLDMDTVVNLHQQNDFQPSSKETGPSSKFANKLHLAMMSENILNMAEATGIIDMGPPPNTGPRVEENIKENDNNNNNNQHVGYVRTEYNQPVPPTDLTILNKPKYENNKPTQEEIKQQHKEERLKERIKRENEEIHKEFELKMDQNSDAIQKQYVKQMIGRANKKEVKLVSEYLDLLKIKHHNHNKYSRKILKEIDKLEEEYVMAIGTKYTIMHFTDLQKDIIRGIDYTFVKSRVNKDQVHDSRKWATSTTATVLSLSVEKLRNYDENHDTELTSRLKQLDTDVKQYRYKQNMKHKRKGKHRRSSKAKNFDFDEQEYEQTKKEIENPGLYKYDEEMEKRSKADSVLLGMDTNPTKPKESDIVNVGGNVHKLNTNRKDSDPSDDPVKSYLYRTGQLKKKR